MSKRRRQPESKRVSKRSSVSDRLIDRLGRFVRDPWGPIDRELPGTGRVDWRVLVVMLTAAVVLTLQEYLGGHDTFRKVFEDVGGDPYYQLKSYAWWTSWRVGGYLVIPAIVVSLMPGERLRDYHLSPRGFFRHLW